MSEIIQNLYGPGRDTYVFDMSETNPNNSKKEFPVVAMGVNESLPMQEAPSVETKLSPEERKDQLTYEIVRELEAEWEKTHGPIDVPLSPTEIEFRKEWAKRTGEKWDGHTTKMSQAAIEFFFDFAGNGQNSVPAQARKILAERYPEYDAGVKEEITKSIEEDEYDRLLPPSKYSSLEELLASMPGQVIELSAENKDEPKGPTHYYSARTGKRHKVPFNIDEQLGYSPNMETNIDIAEAEGREIHAKKEKEEKDKRVRKYFEKHPDAVVGVDQAWDEAYKSKKAMEKAQRHGQKAKKSENVRIRHMDESLLKRAFNQPRRKLKSEYYFGRQAWARKRANTKQERVSHRYERANRIEGSIKEANKVFTGNYTGEISPSDSPGGGNRFDQFAYDTRQEYIKRNFERTERKFRTFGREAIDAAIGGSLWESLVTSMYKEWRAIRASELAKKQQARSRRAHDRYERLR